MTIGNYVGRFVFIERTRDSMCYNGEYFCLYQTPHMLYCTKPVGGYDGHQLHQFPLVGDKTYCVVNSYRDDELGYKIVQELMDFAIKGERGEDKEWIPSVYSGAKYMAWQMKQVLDEQQDKCPLTVPSTRTYSVVPGPPSRTLQISIPSHITQVVIKLG